MAFTPNMTATAPNYMGGGSVPLGNFGGAGAGQAFTQLGAGALGNMLAPGSDPYKSAMDAYDKYLNKGVDTQNPFYNAGTDAIPKYQDWLSGMKDPSSFINNLMNNYQQSTWAQNQKLNATRGNDASASANGLIGSTPWQMQGQQNAANISSQDMQQWLQSVLGINTQYGQGQKGLVDTGAHAADQISNLYGQYGEKMGDAAYGAGASDNNDIGNMLGLAVQVAPYFM